MCICGRITHDLLVPGGHGDIRFYFLAPFQNYSSKFIQILHHILLGWILVFITHDKFEVDRDILSEII